MKKPYEHIKKLATDAELHVRDGGHSCGGRQFIIGKHGIAFAEFNNDGAHDPRIHSALVAHKWNNFDKVLNTLKSVLVYAENEAESLSNAEHKYGEPCGASKAWKTIEDARDLLCLLETVEISYPSKG